MRRGPAVREQHPPVVGALGGGFGIAETPLEQRQGGAQLLHRVQDVGLTEPLRRLQPASLAGPRSGDRTGGGERQMANIVA